jgi:uncharacterized protein (DUF302 family)
VRKPAPTQRRPRKVTLGYYLSTKLRLPFDEAIPVVVEALKTEGFGVLTEIDVQATLKEKLGVDFRRYQILGACNPPFAHRALELEDKIGLMLPCNVIVQELDDGTVEVAAIDPLGSMQAVENAALGELGAEVREKLASVIEAVGAA